MFIWLFVLAFIAFRVVRSSMNYEFGSSRKRTIIRMLVGTATFAAVFIHYALVGALLVSIGTGPTGENPEPAFVITLVAISTGTAMWGFLIPKIVFSFVGTKPVDTDRSDEAQHNTHYNTHQRESEHVQQPVFMRQQPQSNETPLIPPGTPSPISRPTTDEWLVVAPIAEQTDESQPKRPAKPILLGAGVLTLLAFATIAAVWIFNQTGDSHNLAKCDTLLQTQLASSPQLAENAGNANELIDAIQDQRAADCPRDSWNPVVTNITRNHEGNIDVTFSTLPGQTRGMSVTMPAEGTQRWVYLAAKGQWYSVATDGPQTLAVRPTGTPLQSPTANVQPIYTRQPLQTVSAARAPTPTPYMTVRPAYTPRPPSTTLPTVQIPTPTSTTPDNNFDSQRTRVAPTFVAKRTLVPTLVNQEKRHLQWELLTATGTAQQKQYGLAGFRSVNDGKGQQYSCAIYLDGAQVPRVNLSFSKDITYQVVTNQLGEHQGAVNAITTVAGTAVPVEWRTWVSRVDRIRLRDADAARLVHFINEWNANEYVLNLKDNPELSATYDVSNLIAAINANQMTCFQSQ